MPLIPPKALRIRLPSVAELRYLLAQLIGEMWKLTDDLIATVGQIEGSLKFKPGANSIGSLAISSVIVLAKTAGLAFRRKVVDPF